MRDSIVTLVDDIKNLRKNNKDQYIDKKYGFDDYIRIETVRSGVGIRIKLMHNNIEFFNTSPTEISKLFKRKIPFDKTHDDLFIEQILAAYLLTNLPLPEVDGRKKAGEELL